MKSIFENVIKRGGYDLADLLRKIDKYHIEGKLSDDERDELYVMARQTAVARYDVNTEIEKLWKAVRELQNANQSGEGGDTAEEDYPDYIQPSGAHDAYQGGDQVTFNGKRYRCMVDNCVWSPDTLPGAWVEIKEAEG